MKMYSDPKLASLPAKLAGEAEGLTGFVFGPRDSSAIRRRHLLPRAKEQLLHAPVQNFGDVDLVLRWAGHLVYPPELFELLAGLAEHAQDLPVQSELVHAAGERIAAVQHLLRLGRDADRPRRAGRLRPFDILGGHVANRRTSGVTIEGDLDHDLAEKLAVAVEHLNPPVAAVPDVDVALRIGCDGVRR